MFLTNDVAVKILDEFVSPGLSSLIGRYSYQFECKIAKTIPLKFSPDAIFGLSKNRVLLIGYSDLRILNLKTMKVTDLETETYSKTDDITPPCAESSGFLYIAGGYDNDELWSWNLKTGESDSVKMSKTIISLASLPDGKLAIGLGNKTIVIRDLKTGVETLLSKFGSEPIAMAYSSVNNSLLVTLKEKPVALYQEDEEDMSIVIMLISINLVTRVKTTLREDVLPFVGRKEEYGNSSILVLHSGNFITIYEADDKMRLWDFKYRILTHTYERDDSRMFTLLSDGFLASLINDELLLWK